MKADLRILRTLIAVVDSGSIIAASRVRGYSAAAVSRQMGGLQSRLGVQLFTPEGRSIALSTAAIELAARARDVVAAADAFESYSESISGTQPSPPLPRIPASGRHPYEQPSWQPSMTGTPRVTAANEVPTSANRLSSKAQ
ncbi:LysR family transcriptional regulator [Microbacterium sp. ZW CA_36]|uniref:helix-turn-helix domain-containing protein n=1 Tax=Microbacterium sp. ZW CA_36 TaxID=3378078 RepID=UPI003854A3A2